MHNKINTHTNMTSSTDDAMGPIISTVPESHNDLPNIYPINSKDNKVDETGRITTKLYSLSLYCLFSKKGTNPAISVRPYVDFKPTTPQREEGIRTEPVVKVKARKVSK